MTVLSPRRSSLPLESLIFAGRLFTHWRRYPIVPLQALLFPTILLITYDLLVSTSMTRITGTDNLDVLVPVCAVAGGMSGAVGAALSIPYDRDSGLLSRMWILPVHRASALGGTLLAEGARTLAATAIIAAVGLGLGFRFHGGSVALALYTLVPALVVVAFAMVVITIAARSETRSMLTWLSTASLGLVFGSIAPAEVVPSWAQPLVKFQPMAPTIESMRALSHGDPALWPLLTTLGWLLVLTGVFGPMAARAYRSAAAADR